MTDTDAVTGPPARRWRWGWRGALVGGVLVIGAAAGGWTWLCAHQAAQAAQARLDAAEVSAWEDRQALEGVLTETALAVGLTVESEADPYVRAVQCGRNDGRTGFAYLLPAVQAPPVDDAAAMLGAIEEYWQSLGYTTNEGEYLGSSAIRAVTATGAQMRAVAGPAGTGIAGETSCALTDGRPAPEPRAAASCAWGRSGTSSLSPSCGPRGSRRSG